MMVLISYLPPDDNVPCASSIDDAVASAFTFVGRVRAVFSHPKVEGFVILGGHLFATVERSASSQGFYVVRLARYGDGGSRALERRLKKQGYDEVEDADDEA